MPRDFDPRTTMRAACAALVALCAQGCIVGSDTCSPHQVPYIEADINGCVCEENAVPKADGTGCTPCGPNAEIVDRQCACEAGFERPTAADDCEKAEVPDGPQPGSPCEEDGDCTEPFALCALHEGEDSYCTRTDCAANADCPQGYTCEDGDDARYCRMPPSGLGDPCASADDCTGQEAQFCETFQTNTCLVGGCAAGEAVCRNEWTCCDFTVLSTCLSPDELEDGACPSGGKPVTP